MANSSLTFNQFKFCPPHTGQKRQKGSIPIPQPRQLTPERIVG